MKKLLLALLGTAVVSTATSAPARADYPNVQDTLLQNSQRTDGHCPVSYTFSAKIVPVGTWTAAQLAGLTYQFYNEYAPRATAYPYVSTPNGVQPQTDVETYATAGKLVQEYIGLRDAGTSLGYSTFFVDTSTCNAVTPIAPVPATSQTCVPLANATDAQLDDMVGELDLPDLASAKALAAAHREFCRIVDSDGNFYAFSGDEGAGPDGQVCKTVTLGTVAVKEASPHVFEVEANGVKLLDFATEGDAETAAGDLRALSQQTGGLHAIRSTGEAHTCTVPGGKAASHVAYWI